MFFVTFVAKNTDAEDSTAESRLIAALEAKGYANATIIIIVAEDSSIVRLM